VNGKRHQRTLTFNGAKYPKEADVRKAIELPVSQIDSGTAREKADQKFGAIITIVESTNPWHCLSHQFCSASLSY
jgi:hypothetical protein